jgi:hypothetical protein
LEFACEAGASGFDVMMLYAVASAVPSDAGTRADQTKEVFESHALATPYFVFCARVAVGGKQPNSNADKLAEVPIHAIITTPISA